MTISPYKKNFGLPDSVIESVKGVLAKPKPVVVEDNKPKIKYDLNGKPVIMEEVEQIEEAYDRKATYANGVTVHKSSKTSNVKLVHPEHGSVTYKWMANRWRYKNPRTNQELPLHDLRALTNMWSKGKEAGGKNTTVKEEIELEEGRGRPRKTPLAAGEDEGNEPDQNIIMQLRKAVSMKGMKPVKFQNGEKHNISPAKAIAVLRIHTGLKSSIEKGNFEKKLAHSHDSFMKHSAVGANHGAPLEKKSRITLPAVNRLKLRKPIED